MIVTVGRHSESQDREVNAVRIGAGERLAIIAGPCVIESVDHADECASFLAALRDRLSVPLIYKSSFDKANRTASSSFRGLGLQDGLRILQHVRTRYRLPVVTDIHEPSEAEEAARVVDLLQIPAFLCRQTDLLVAAGKTGLPVLIKKGQFLHPSDMSFAQQKVQEAGNGGVLLCERGTCFGYRDLVVDMRGLALMAQCGAPVVFDATHSVQQMGGATGRSGGCREYVPLLARAAVAAGVDAVFLECHPNPDAAPSDGPNMLPFDAVEDVLSDLFRLHEISLRTRGNTKDSSASNP